MDDLQSLDPMSYYVHNNQQIMTATFDNESTATRTSWCALTVVGVRTQGRTLNCACAGVILLPCAGAAGVL